ncbi:MAG: hypothetical protein IT355_14960 [Gemmatimonadaceae bacterium]|nr:hypothetical protein [Gemmatimonadaceae bacterium]
MACGLRSSSRMLVALVLIAAGAAKVHGQARVSPSRRDSLAAPAAPFHALSVGSYVLSRLDDNVNRDPVGVSSVGVIGGGTVRLASGAVRPLLQLEYDAAVHRYTATTRFNRVSQRLRTTLSRRVVRWWTLELVTEGALKGSSEDRDVSNQLQLVPTTEFRLGSARRLRLGAAQRWRRFPLDSMQDATNRYVTAEFRHRFMDGAEFETEARIERNLAVGDRFDYRRSSYSMSYDMPLGRAVRVEFGMQYRQQRYSGRFAEVDDRDVPRVDHRLQPAAALQVRLGASELNVSYEPEWRRSNDPDKAISQNLVMLGVRRRWF